MFNTKYKHGKHVTYKGSVLGGFVTIFIGIYILDVFFIQLFQTKILADVPRLIDLVAQDQQIANSTFEDLNGARFEIFETKSGAFEKFKLKSDGDYISDL